jgi:hypothetical protein
MTKHGCDYSVRIELRVGEHSGVGAGMPPRTGLRKFIVEYDADGEVLRIKEIRQLPPLYGVARVYHASYWKASTHALGNGDTLPKRIIAAARAKLDAEERSINATP